MLDRNRMRQHHFDVTYVLGTIGQYNYRRYYTEVGTSDIARSHITAERPAHLRAATGLR